MSSAATFNATLQVIAALLMFVAVYLALVLCTTMCLVASELISEHASVLRDYGVRPVSLDTRVLSEIDVRHANHLANPSHVVFQMARKIPRDFRP
jgi:hypothetical protein